MQGKSNGDAIRPLVAPTTAPPEVFIFTKQQTTHDGWIAVQCRANASQTGRADGNQVEHQISHVPAKTFRPFAGLLESRRLK